MRPASLTLLALASIAITLPCEAAKRGNFASGYMYSYYVPPAAGTPWRPCSRQQYN